MPRTEGRARRISARSDPVPPPTSTTVRTDSQPPETSTSGSGMPCPAGPINASKLAAISRMGLQILPERAAEDLVIGRRTGPHGTEQAAPRVGHATADAVEIEAET